MSREPLPLLHAHSYFSLGRGCLSPEEICRHARLRGCAAVGLTDTGNFYGLVRFLRAAEREGLRAVVGAVLPAGPCTAYALDRRGFARLGGIITALKAGARLEDQLREGWEGLALLVEGPGALLRLLRGPGARPPDNLYVRLVYGREFRSAVRCARELDLPLCAVNDAWYVEPRDRELCSLLRAMARNVRLDSLPPEERPGDRHRAVPDAEMERFFSAVPEALESARRLAEQADSGGIIPPREEERGAARPGARYVFPRFDDLSEEESCRRLESLCRGGILRRYGGPTPEVEARLGYELDIIRRKGFAGYFLVVHDIVSRFPRTCGRGSSAASIVSYLLGITHVDPLRCNLFFERFLNMDRQDPPDIDVDFPWDEREKALRYVFRRYPGRAGMVADHVTFRERSSLREPAKALGFGREEIGRFIRFARYGEWEKIPAPLRRISERIRGFPRYLGTHPGGVVITPGPITDYTHLQTSPLGLPVIAWEKDAAEEAGLVKIDLLGNRSLGVLRDTLQRVNARRAEETGGTPLTWEGFNPLEDRDTRQMIARGETLGVFYVESPATRQLLAKMQRGDYENLVIASSIIRPAANRYIREFVRRLHGTPYAPIHPALEETLKETYGIMVYQEDVSRVAIDLAGFSPGEADRLRKVLSKRDRELRLAAFRERFFAGGRSRGVPAEALEKVWEMILSFDGYSFCKPHSASYALVSYRLAWLKRYYPLEFFVSVINNGGGYYTRQTYVNECRRAGFPTLPPDINRSLREYSVERGAEHGATLRAGLEQLRELSRETVGRILAERERGGAFAGFFDFLQRLPLGPAEMRLLILSGCLDSISEGLTRPQMFWAYFRTAPARGQGGGLRIVRNPGPRISAGKAEPELPLPGDLFPYPPVPAFIGDYSPARKLRDEIRTLGLMISRHPLTVFRRRLVETARREGFRRLITSRQLSACVGRRISLGGLLVTGKEVPTRKREPMIFVSFEDEHSIYETVFFPPAFRRFFPVLDGGGVFLLSGRVQDEMGAISVHVERIVRLSRRAEALPAPPVAAGYPVSAPFG